MALKFLGLLLLWSMATVLPCHADIRSQAQIIETALAALGDNRGQLEKLIAQPASKETSLAIQKLLDRESLIEVTLLPNGRIDIRKGQARPFLLQAGWKNYLVKVVNPAGITDELTMVSPQAEPLYHQSAGNPLPLAENLITDDALANRFLEIVIYRGRPFSSALSGAPLEYRIVQIYTQSPAGRRASLSVELRDKKTTNRVIKSSMSLNFDFGVIAATKVTFRVHDQNDSPTMASFTIFDGIQRFARSDSDSPLPEEYRYRHALRRPWERIWQQGRYRDSIKPGPRLDGIYPLPAQRLAKRDAFPDFYFQAQIYRRDGEYVYLPPGEYEVTFGRGPEYLAQTQKIKVEKVKNQEVSFRLKRWINLAELGWYSSDLHVHAAGCKHYETPEAGVPPEYMWRQSLGEDLNVTAVLNWGLGWYDQKKYFDQQFSQPLATEKNLLRYDLEISEMPSGQLGHLGLWNLTEDDYPGTKKLEQWPSWTLPILQWARSQGAVTGYVHTGWGMEPDQQTTDLPNYILPKMDGIGANEFVVTLAANKVDLFGAGDTAPAQELNSWYHALNAGFRTRLSGESDFPCVYHERIGVARGYAKLDKPLNFQNYIEQMKAGRSYVSDGRSHIIEFKAAGQELGVDKSELRLTGASDVVITARVSAYLPDQQDDLGAFIAGSSSQRQPAWHIERARIGQTRKVRVELVVNGIAAASREVLADGDWRNISFNYPLKESSWVALRIYPSSHTNPIFVIVDNKPIRASKRSAEWLHDAVDRLWQVKSGSIREQERNDAKIQYEKAKKIYQQIISESVR